MDPVEAASFLELETRAPETPAPASPKSPKRKGKGKKSAKPSRIAPSKAPAKASAKKPAVSTAPFAGTTATAAAVPAEVVGSAPDVPSPKAKVPVSEPASGSGIRRLVPPHLSLAYYSTPEDEPTSEESVEVDPKSKGKCKGQNSPKIWQP